ncbi:MAG: Rrf2 family transcriptional regulator [Lachnospiraceae bacterium]|nr:Rrf2 family transcriptional regulator [Lachnospiraceae bacterium]
MKISTKGRYGLRAMLDLAKHDIDGEAVSVQSISQRQNISESYLEQLVRMLRTAGLIKSVRGAGGGYKLAKSPDRISVGDVLRACEGDIEVVSCTSAGEEENSCNQAERCVARIVWETVNNAIEDAVDSLSLQRLLDESKDIDSEQLLDTTKCVN